MSDELRPWWRCRPDPNAVLSAGEDLRKAVFKEGDQVVLRARPERVREVLRVEWHNHRHEYCYYLETSTTDDGNPCPAYWFADQLMLERGNGG